MRPGIVVHQEEPRTYCTSVGSDHGFKDFIPIPNGSQTAVLQPVEVCSSLHGYASPDHHWPTTKPVMLNDVAGSIAFSLASPDPFTSITDAQGEPALICEKHRAPVADMPILVFYSKCQSSSTVLGSEHRAHYRTSRPEATLMKSVSDCLGRDIHSSGLLEVIL